MQSLGNQFFDLRIPVFTGFFAVFLWFAILPDVVAADSPDVRPSEAAVIQVAGSGFAPASQTGATAAKNPGQLLAADAPVKAANSATVPGSVIALVVALIAVVAVARRDTSGTTQNP